MAHYHIAGLTVEMTPRYELLKRRAAPFATSATPPDLTLQLDDAYLAQKQQENPQNSAEQTEYMWIGAALAGKLWRFDAMTIHASAISVDDRAYLFSADSGVGKSTHTRMWLEQFGDRAFLINDDKPIVRLEQDGFFVYGSPFSGHCDENRQTRVKLGAILFMRRAECDVATTLDAATAIQHLIRQSGISRNPKAAAAKLHLLDRLIQTVPIGELGCTMNPSAVDTAYQWIKGESVHED